MEARATAKYVRMSPRKVRLVLQQIKGKYAQLALDTLKFTPNHAADEVANVLRSAMANAENNHDMATQYLKISECFVDPGPTAKRVQPRAQGRAYRILKRTSHITVVVEEGTPPPVTGPKELAIQRRGPKPPLLAQIAQPVVAAAPVATIEAATEATTTTGTEATTEPTSEPTTETATVTETEGQN